MNNKYMNPPQIIMFLFTGVMLLAALAIDLLLQKQMAFVEAILQQYLG